MSNWKYGTVPQRERLEMIRGGNDDVYEEEIRRSQNLYNVRKDFGLDTSEVEEYKSYITNAYNKAKKQSDPRTVNRTANTPVFYDAITDKALNNFYEKAISFSNSYIDEKENAKDKAKTRQNVLDEWIAANGHSKSGKLYKERSEEIRSELDAELEKIKATYNRNIESTRQILQNALLKR